MKLLLSLALVSLMGASSIYEFKETSLDGKTIDFSKYKGKKILVVNVASECGYTYQYEDLQKLSEKYKDKKCT